MLKPYMGYSREGGACEGAVLIFAHTIREAKKIGWIYMRHTICDGVYTDMVAKLVKGDYLYKDANQDKLKNDIPHVIDNPTSCKDCEMWGTELDENGICESCREEE